MAQRIGMTCPHPGTKERSRKAKAGTRPITAKVPMSSKLTRSRPEAMKLYNKTVTNVDYFCRGLLKHSIAVVRHALLFHPTSRAFFLEPSSPKVKMSSYHAF